MQCKIEYIIVLQKLHIGDANCQKPCILNEIKYNPKNEIVFRIILKLIDAYF